MSNKKGYVCFDNSCVEAELALTQEDRLIGLMNRTFLPENEGMLFIFDKESIHKFWMKNLFINLDVIWLNDMGRIIHIDKNVMPCDEYCKSFGPELPVKFVLEVNGLYTDRHNINVGDIVRMIL
jgi:uncharacterized membrane protein (UPF0127 family)